MNPETGDLAAVLHNLLAVRRHATVQEIAGIRHGCACGEP
jgi:hypothetical protein